MVVNMDMAGTLGLAAFLSLLAQADEVIE